MSSYFFQNSFSRSILLHFGLLILAFFFASQLPKAQLNSENIEISFVEPTKKADSKQAVVQQSAGELSKVSKDKAFLSDQTRVVKEERSAQNSAKSASSAKLEQNQGVKLSDLGVKISPKASPNYNQERNWAKPETGEMLGGGQYIQGMKEGEVSALNTKEFVFYSYFERVRKQLEQAWQPIVRENIQKIVKTGRHLASNADYVTKAMVTMDQKGQIIRVQLLEESGAQDLDQAAVDALNRAGPYPNPPRGLVDSSGNVQIRWDFILKT